MRPRSHSRSPAHAANTKRHPATKATTPPRPTHRRRHRPHHPRLPHPTHPGLFDSPDSDAQYARVLRTLAQNGGRWPVAATNPDTVSVNEVVLAFLRHAERRYPDSAEYEEYRYAAGPLVDLFGTLPAAEFSPKKLRAVRDGMVKAGLCRNVVNRRVGRVKALFKWAVGEELIPGGVYAALQAVRAIGPNTPGVRESEPTRPASFEDVEPLLSLLTRPSPSSSTAEGW